MWWCQNHPAWDYKEANPGKRFLEWYHDVLGVPWLDGAGDPAAGGLRLDWAAFIGGGAIGVNRRRQHCSKLYVWLNRSVSKVTIDGKRVPRFSGDAAYDHVLHAAEQYADFSGSGVLPAPHREGWVTLVPGYPQFGYPDPATPELSMKPYYFPNCGVRAYALCDPICPDLSLDDVHDVIEQAIMDDSISASSFSTGAFYDVIVPVVGQREYITYLDGGVWRSLDIILPEDGTKRAGPIIASPV